MFSTDFTRRLRVNYPIIQAGMAGGPATPELVAAVSSAGALGTLGAGYMTPKDLRLALRRIRDITDQPFAVNLFVPTQVNEVPGETERMNTFLNHYRKRLGINQTSAVTSFAPSFEEQVMVVIEEKIPVFSFTFGLLSDDVVSRLHECGTVVMGTATTVEEAIQIENHGADIVIAQGSEAGGHRGTFSVPAEQALIGTMALVPQIVDAVKIPVVAAGGIMDGRGLVAAMALGACAVQMGTAFLACPQSGAHAVHKRAVLTRREDETDVTYAYSGKAARAIRSSFMASMDDYSGPIPPYPIQNALTRDIREAAKNASDGEYMSLWAGQGLRMSSSDDAAELVQRVIKEAQQVALQLDSRKGQ